MNESPQYAGFWIRVWASVVDGVLLAAVTVPVLLAVYGMEYLESEKLFVGYLDFVLQWIFPTAAIIAFWAYKSATPGKMAISAVIVDAASGGKPSLPQFIGRYFAYLLSGLVLGLGFIWIGFDKRKQGWHDKLAGTVVVRVPRGVT